MTVKIKSICILVCLSLLLLALPGTCSAQEEMYQISRTELNELMAISNQLDSTTTLQLQNYLELKKQLNDSKQLIVHSQKQISDYQNLTTDLTSSLNKALQENRETKNSLTELNKSFSEYKKEVQQAIKKEQRARKRERLLWIIGTGALMYLSK